MHKLLIGIIFVVALFFLLVSGFAGFIQTGEVDLIDVINDVKENDQVGFAHAFQAEGAELKSIKFEVNAPDIPLPDNIEFKADIYDGDAMTCQADPVIVKDLNMLKKAGATFLFQKCSLEKGKTYEMFIWTDDIRIEKQVQLLKISRFFDKLIWDRFKPEGNLPYEIKYEGDK